MSAIVAQKQLLDTIEMYKTRLERLRENNQTLKELIESSVGVSSIKTEQIVKLEHKLSQYQEVAHALCAALQENIDLSSAPHSTKSHVDEFLFMWRNEDMKVFCPELKQNS